MARPNLSYLKNLALALTGVIVGIWTGLTGMGAGLILSPALAWLLALRDRTLTQTVLVATTLASLFALIAYGQEGKISFILALEFALANAIGIRIGAWKGFDRTRESRNAPMAWSVAILFIAGWLMYNASHGAGAIAAVHPHAHWPIRLWVGAVVSGFATGLAAKLGNLGGLLSVPCLIVVAGATPLAAQATALTALVIVSAIPATAVIVKHRAPAATAGWTAFGAVLGAMAGSRIAVGLPSLRLILIYGAGMYIVGLMRLLVAWPQTSRH